MRIALVTAGYPPDLDGIGDYTWCMAQSLASNGQIQQPVTVFVSSKADRSADAGVEVIRCFDLERQRTFANLESNVAGRALDWLVVQYNPFCYGSRGFCPAVPTTIKRIGRVTNGPRVAAMFHETYVPLWPWKFSVMSLWQRPIFRSICLNVDLAMVSTERWTRQVRQVAPSLSCQHLPVGSTVPFCDISQEQARQAVGIPADGLVLGVFGSAHISRSLGWIADTAKAAAVKHPNTRLLYVGTDGFIVRSSCREVEVVDGGVQPMARVGMYLRAMDLVLAPFADGISTRRTSVMAPLQHGVPVATTISANSDPIFQTAAIEGLLLSHAECSERFVEEVCRWLQDRNWRPKVPCPSLRTFYEQNFTWDKIAATMTQSLAAHERGA